MWYTISRIVNETAMPLRSIKQLKHLSGQRVLVRVDFNIPLHNGRVVDDFKIERALPTIKYLMSHGARVVLMSHLGRPKGFDSKLSLRPVQVILEKLLGSKVKMLKIGKLEDEKIEDWRNVASAIEKLPNGEVAMLENIRFFPGEEKNDRALAKQLAGLGDVFVLDGFAVAHRAAASVSGIVRFIPSYAGLLLLEEINVLSKVKTKPRRPLLLIMGGVKVETKIPIVKNFLKIADAILVGGAVATTYLWAKGYRLGQSVVEKSMRKLILQIGKSKKVIMPVDLVVGLKNGRVSRVIKVDKNLKLSSEEAIYDVGPDTVRLFAGFIKRAQMIFWNGALGQFEVHPYEYGTFALAQLIAARSQGRAYGVVGGGETVEVVKKLGLTDDIDFISTGGGALLEFLSGKKLPGLQSIMRQ